MRCMGWACGVALVAAVASCGRSPLAPFDTMQLDGDDIAEEPLPDDCDLSSHENDCDGDGIPDADDPAPADPSEPGMVRRDVIYANTGDALFVLDPSTLEIEEVGTFGGGAVESITDIAIDRFGVLYAVGFSALYVCSPADARCEPLAPASANAAAFVPVGAVTADDDALIVMGPASQWTHAMMRGAEATLIPLGDVGPTYASSGDIVAAQTGMTLFTSPSSTGFDIVVSVDAATAAIDAELASTPSVYGTFGLAAFGGAIWLFDSAGGIARMNPQTYAITSVSTASQAWWGAAAHPDSQ